MMAGTMEMPFMCMTYRVVLYTPNNESLYRRRWGEMRQVSHYYATYSLIILVLIARICSLPGEMHDIFVSVCVCLVSPGVAVLCAEALVANLVRGVWRGGGGDMDDTLGAGNPFTTEHTSTAIVTRRTSATITMR